MTPMTLYLFISNQYKSMIYVEKIYIRCVGVIKMFEKIYTWNLFVLYFGASNLKKKALSNQNNGHLGSRYNS